MAKVTIDGKVLDATEGSLILEAAAADGISIPTFCYQKRLTPLASCRMCLVEIEGQAKLAPACVTYVADGMIVRTNTAKVADTRESMLELLLANHPLDCPICDKAGECELQDTVFEYGAGASRFRDEKRVFRSQDLPLNQVIIFNANRCIQCQRCVRSCEEVVGAVALGTMDRGMDSEITGFANSLSSCDHCGNCIEVCPVGALMSAPYRYTSRPWDLVETDTTCTYCGTGCQLSIGVRDKKLARVRSKYETGLNGETLCVKGRFGADFIDAENRIEKPMVRKDGILEPVSWFEALETLARHIGMEPGNGHHGGLASPSLNCETLYMFQKMMRTVFQSNSVSSSNRWSPIVEAGADFASELPVLLTNFYTKEPLETLLKADCIFVVGSDVTNDNPVTDYLIRLSLRDKPGRLLIASARPSRLDQIAEDSLRVLPGEEATLFAALEADLTSGSAGRFEPSFSNFVENGGRILASAHTVTLLIGSDVLRSVHAKDTLQWLQIYLITLKSVGKKVSVQFLFDRCNQLGAWEMGLLPSYLPGWRPVINENAIAPLEEFWGQSLSKVPGKNTGDILQTAATGELDTLFCLHSDPLSFFPDRALAKAALTNAKILVVQGSHHTPTTELAHIVLPGAGFAEESGTVLNNEGRLQRVRAIRKPRFDARVNLNVFTQIAAALGKNLKPIKPEDVFGEIVSLVPSFSGVSITEVGENGVFTSAARSAFIPKKPSLSPSLPPPIDNNGEAYSLITGNSRFHSGGLSIHSQTLSGIEGIAYAEMNKNDATELGIQEGDEIIVRRSSWSIQLSVKLNTTFPRKVLFIPENFPDLQLNQLWVNGEYPYAVEIIKNDRY